MYVICMYVSCVILVVCLYSEVSRSLHKTEERLKDVKKVRDELEMAIDSLRDDLSKTEHKKKDLQHKVRFPGVSRAFLPHNLTLCLVFLTDVSAGTFC